MNAVISILYGSISNLGLYTKPDGPVENWSELLPLGKIDEVRQAQKEAIKEKYPELGMVGEFVLGMHGKLTYQGNRLAGMYPHQQVKAAEKAGVSIFGLVVNTNSNKSLAWNLSRTVTFVKACTQVANIPVHCNVGMGVDATPMTTVLPADAVSRVIKTLIESVKLMVCR